MKVLPILIVVGVLGIIIFLSINIYLAPGELDDFAACISESGAVMYGTDWCGVCKEQKALFGKSFGHITYVECDRNKPICQEKGIRGYPTWIINGKKHSGFRGIETLSSLTGCSL